MRRTNQLVVIEELNIISIIYLILNWHRLNEVIYISKSRFLRSKFAKKLLQWLERLKTPQGDPFPGRQVDYYDFPGSYFDVAVEAIDHVNERLYAAYGKENAYVNFLVRFKNHPFIEKAIKKILLYNYTMSRVKAVVLLDHIITSHPDNTVIFIPCDNLDVAKFTSTPKASGAFVPPSIKLANRVIEFFGRIQFFVYIHRVLLGIILHKGILWGEPKIKRFPVAYGIMKTFTWYGDYFHTFIYDQDLFKPENVLLILAGSPNDKTQKEFAKRGYPYVIPTHLAVPVKYFLTRVGEFYLKAMGFALVGMFSRGDRSFLVPFVSPIARNIIDTEVFYAHYRVDVFITRQESVFHHIINKIILGELGGKIVGYPRGNYGLPNYEIAYICVDHFCLWGEAGKAPYSHHSIGSFEVIGAGFPGLDRTYNRLLTDTTPEKYHEIKDKYRILIAFDNVFAPDIWNSKEMIMHFNRTVIALHELYDDLFIVLKPKTVQITDEEYAELIGDRPRVIVEKGIKTYDMLHICEFVICITGTSIGIESIVANKKTLFFDVPNVGEEAYFREYDERLVSKTAEELYQNVEWLLQGNYIPSETLKRLQQEHGYNFDGKTVERFKQVIHKALPTN